MSLLKHSFTSLASIDDAKGRKNFLFLSFSVSLVLSLSVCLSLLYVISMDFQVLLEVNSLQHSLPLSLISPFLAPPFRVPFNLPKLLANCY